MSASAITDGLISLLTASDAFGTGGAATHYGVMESTSGSCCVVGWLNLSQSMQTFGSPTIKENIWTHSIECFVKDLGQPEATLRRILASIDTVASTLAADDTIQGTVENIMAVRASRELDNIFEAGGAAWFQINIEVDSREWPDG